MAKAIVSGYVPEGSVAIASTSLVVAGSCKLRVPESATAHFVFGEP